MRIRTRNEIRSTYKDGVIEMEMEVEGREVETPSEEDSVDEMEGCERHFHEECAGMG